MKIQARVYYDNKIQNKGIFEVHRYRISSLPSTVTFTRNDGRYLWRNVDAGVRIQDKTVRYGKWKAIIISEDEYKKFMMNTRPLTRRRSRTKK